jgi:hypothetical protein
VLWGTRLGRQMICISNNAVVYEKSCVISRAVIGFLGKRQLQAKNKANKEMSDAPASCESAGAILQEVCLAAAGETSLPRPFTLENNRVIRTPALWIVLFEKRGWVKGDFRSADGALGPACREFRELLRGTYLTEDGRLTAPEHALDACTREFQSMGLLFSIVPLSAGDPRGAAETLVSSLDPQIRAAIVLLRNMSAALITALGGVGERYLAARLLDPSRFSASEAEAVRRGTVRPEGYVHGKRNREDGEEKERSSGRTCAKCHRFFPGTWKEHWHGYCAKNPAKGMGSTAPSQNL